MSSRKSSNRGNYRISLRLDSELDADLIAWLEKAPKGKRSDILRTMMREYLSSTFFQSRQELAPANLEAIRSAVADEIRKALKYMETTGESPTQNHEQLEMETKYGDKLNQMLGGFASRQSEHS